MIGRRLSHYEIVDEISRGGMGATWPIGSKRLGPTCGPEITPKRSVYLLAQLYEQRGDLDRARQHYARFVALWGDGDMEREWVSDARSKLGR
jgi:hypothetical protein